jgi:hypothetical protein
MSEKQGFHFRHSEAGAFVPSSVSEERELGASLPEEKTSTINGSAGHRQHLAADWDMDSGVTNVPTTLSRPITATSTTTPSSTDKAAAPSASPPELLDEKTRAEQIIKEIKLKARAFAQAQESSPPVLEIPSPITSDDDDDENDDGVGGRAALNFRPSTKLKRCSKSPNA